MTKSIRRLRLTSSCTGLILIYVILVHTSSTDSSPPPCGLYGAPPCQFLPAPPGQSPSCARPGKTYCEHVENYPTLLIKTLVRKWGYEATNLLVDETWEDFAAVAWHDTPVFYDPKSIFPARDYNGQDFNGYNYQTPFGNSPHGGATPSNSLFISNPTTESPTYLLYTSAGQRLNYNKQQQQPPVSNTGEHLYYNNGGKSTPYNATLWLKRLVRDLGQKKKAKQALLEKLDIVDELAKPDQWREQKQENELEQLQAAEDNKRDVSLNMDLLDIVGVQGAKKARTKRQSPGRSELCQTSSQFIEPQAALNSRGNWMFVVNEQNTARQMVKTEVCASNTCSNLCSLPNGYNSRCEQKFVQKRLIALQGNGQNLYTDSFWFPSCCVCTIAAN